MTITPLPPAPNRTDPATFSDKADNFVAALSGFVTEANSLASDVNTDASSASTSASNAASSATASANSATASANSATASAGSATSSANSATASENSATASANSATAAANSATEAAASAASIDPDNIDINGGTIDGTVIGGSTPAAISGTTGSFSGDVSIADKIVHTGDTNTAIRFPSNDTVTVETDGSERMRITSTGTLQSPGGSAFVGTVATGSTLGAIIQRGSNANGEFVRFADGTQICTITGVTMTFSLIGSVEYVWTYPATFSSLPAPAGTWRNAVGATPVANELGPINVPSNSSTSGTFRVLRITGLTDFVSGDTISNVALTAIGRWF